MKILAIIVLGGAIHLAATVALADSPAKKAEPAPAGDSAESIGRLIDQLGNSNFFLREKAQEELARLGADAFDALNEASSHADLEVAARARYLLRLIRMQWGADTDPVPVKNLLHDYHAKDMQQRLECIQSLGALPKNQGVPALCRLVRFEESLLIAKHAAAEIIGRQGTEQELDADLAKIFQKHLGQSPRTAAQWLRCLARFSEAPAAALVAWTALADAEQLLLDGSARQTDAQVVAVLRRFQIGRLEKLGRNDDAIAAMQSLIDVEKGTPESLAELIQWLVKRQAWKAIDAAAARLGVYVEKQPLLLYELAHAQLVRGDAQQAAALVQKAMQLFPGKDDGAAQSHYWLAERLLQKGWHAWAEGELRIVVANGSPQFVVIAQFQLAQMLHDQDDNLRAAQALQAVDEAFGKKLSDDEEVADRPIKEIRAQANYMLACHWKSQGDAARHRHYLDEALKHDPSDVDVLIACFRLTDATPEYAQRIRGLIKSSAVKLRSDIVEDADDHVSMNQFAWLIGNTEGDFDEALRYSKRSVELSPQAGGYFDTLGRVYYAKGDFASAVKYQSKAVELEPHSGLIARQLDLFRKALAEKKPAAKPQG